MNDSVNCGVTWLHDGGDVWVSPFLMMDYAQWQPNAQDPSGGVKGRGHETLDWIRPTRHGLSFLCRCCY